MANSLRPRTRVVRRLRRNSTGVERLLWRYLREHLAPYKFRRQHPIGGRIADFACPGRKLAIEVDGGQHSDDAEADEKRSAESMQHGYRIIRFRNNKIMENMEGVLQRIAGELEMPPPHPDPLRPGGAERAD